MLCSTVPIGMLKNPEHTEKEIPRVKVTQAVKAACCKKEQAYNFILL